MLVTPTQSAGVIAAARRSSDGWLTGLVDLRIDSGEIVVSADATGAVTLDRLGIAIAPIDIPESVIGHGAQLTDVRVDLADPVRVTGDWNGDDELRATVDIELVLRWSLVVDGSSAPLGSPDLPAVPVELVLTGDGATVQSELRVHAPGELWNWASLVRLTDLELILAARTTD